MQLPSFLTPRKNAEKQRRLDHACDEQIAALLSDSPPTAKLRPMTVPIPGCGPSSRQKSPPPALVIEEFLTANECQALIALSEARGYQTATINTGTGKQRSVDSVRRSGRCMIDSALGARVLFDRLEPHLVDAGLAQGPKGGWRRCVELNERLRFLRYNPGDYFKPHQDGRYIRDFREARAGDESLLTLMLYLNTPSRGGSTNFLGDGPTSKVAPKTGMALVFDHSLLHEGATLEAGQKYCIRTDVMYTRRADKPPAPAPERELAPPVTVVVTGGRTANCNGSATSRQELEERRTWSRDG